MHSISPNSHHPPACATPALRVEGLNVEYRVDGGDRQRYATAVNGVSFEIAAGETLGIVGESGSGKSSIALACMRLLPPMARCGGRIILGGTDLTALDERELRSVRGCRIGLIFQDASRALNPVRTVGSQIADTARTHDPTLTRTRARELAAEMLQSLGVPAQRLRSYPHQLSGGMRQRALIATTMIAKPSFLLADEPTSALDKLTENQIVLLLRSLQRERGLGFVVISHDLRVISSLCRDVMVMHRGEVVEYGPTQVVLSSPQHPYTAGLVRASRYERDRDGRFATVPVETEAQPSPA